MGRRRGIRDSRGRIQIDYSWQGERRREVLPWRDTDRNRAKAELFKAELDECTTELDLYRAYARHHPDSRFHAGKTVEVLLVEWLERIKRTIAPSTFRDYLNSVEHHLVPTLGKRHIQELRWRHIRDFLEGYPDASKKRLHNLLIPLKQVCDRAIENEEILISPMHGQKVGGKASGHNPDPLTLDEMQALIRKAEAGFGNMIDFACWTGLRTGELIALSWSHVDWVADVVRISANVAGGVKKRPKTAAGVRDVVLLPPARDALLRQKALTVLAGDRIFHDPLTGKPWTNDSAIRKRWMPLLTRAGVRYRRPYSTRDTYASRLLSAGENVLWVARQMGHRDWLVLRRSYAAWIDDAANGGAAIAAQLAPKTATPRQRPRENS
ncbi:MAG: tyrosine-type recombinase/integrase [Gammaproteobacteria bacterium]|nr:tyrosine-type recombinase/integrase [Gammaproteobacteria bacterium]